MFGLFKSKKKQQPKRITDELLGELYYEAPAWRGGMDFKLFGKTYDIDIEMISENDAPVNAAQKESYQKILNNDEITAEIEKVLLAQFLRKNSEIWSIDLCPYVSDQTETAR